MTETRVPPLAENGISLIIPIYNESEGIGSFLNELQSFLVSSPFPTEVIIVDDGSTDDTPTQIKRLPYKVIRHETNRGYGAAIKSGIEQCQHEIIAIMDADGTYPFHELPVLCQNLNHYDMVVGARTGPDAHIPWTRRPAKWLIRLFAGWLVQQPIPDLNSGMRAIRRTQLEPIRRLLPDGFSLTTTLTVAFHTTGKRICYHPIEYRQRSGNSKFHPITDTWNMILLILRTVVLLRPLNVFLPLSFLFAILAIGIGFYSKFFTEKFMDATFIVLMMASVQMFVLGLIADLIVRVHLWTH